jgi:hypothetical protein
VADLIRNCCGWFRRKVCLGEDGVTHSKFRAGFPSGVRRRPSDTWRTGRTLSRARELAAVGQGWARTDSERDSTRLEQVHRRRRLRWFGGNAQLHCCRARLRGLCRDGSIGGRMRGLRVRGVLEHAGGWCQQVGGCGKGTPRLAIIANQRASEPSEWLGVRRRGETANSSACWNGLHAGMDCMLEWIASWNRLNGILPRCRCARQKSGPCCWVHHACM